MDITNVTTFIMIDEGSDTIGSTIDRSIDRLIRIKIFLSATNYAEKKNILRLYKYFHEFDTIIVKSLTKVQFEFEI